MKYSEYQVWYHVYTNAITSIINYDKLPDSITQLANYVAMFAVDKFKEVTDIPQTPNLDLSGLVEKVLKDAKK